MASKLIDEYEDGSRSQPGIRDQGVTKNKTVTPEEAAKAAAEAAEKAATEREVKAEIEQKKQKKAALEASQTELKQLSVKFRQDLDNLITSLTDPVEKTWAWIVGSSTPVYSDLISDVGCESTSPLLVDGDSLLFDAVLNPVLDWSHGGEFEHLLFLLLTNLRTFMDLNLSPTVLFFQNSAALWAAHPKLLLFRRLFCNHLARIPAVRVLDEFSSPASEEFTNYVFRAQPSCFVLTDGSFAPADFRLAPHSLDTALASRLFKLNLFHILGYAQLRCVLTRNLYPKDQHISGFVFNVTSPSPALLLESTEAERTLVAPHLAALHELGSPLSSYQTSSSSSSSSSSTTSSSLPTTSMADLLRELILKFRPLHDAHDVSLDLLRLYVLHLLILQRLPADSRSVVLRHDLLSAREKQHNVITLVDRVFDQIFTLFNQFIHCSSFKPLNGHLFWALLEVFSTTPIAEHAALFAEFSGIELLSQLFPNVSSPSSFSNLSNLFNDIPLLQVNSSSSSSSSSSDSQSSYVKQHSNIFRDLFDDVDFASNTQLEVAEAKTTQVVLGSSFPERYKWHLGRIVSPEIPKLTIPTDPRERRRFLRNLQKNDAFFHRYALSLACANELGSLRMISGKIMAHKQAETSSGSSQQNKKGGKAAKPVKSTGNSRAEEIKLQNTLKREHDEVMNEITKLENNRKAFSGSLDETLSKLESFINSSKYPIAVIQAKIYALELTIRLWTDAFHKSGRNSRSQGPSAALNPRSGLYYAIRSVRLIFELVAGYARLPSAPHLQEIVDLGIQCLRSLGFDDAIDKLKQLAKVCQPAAAVAKEEESAKPAGRGKGKAPARARAGPSASKAPAPLDVKLKFPKLDAGKVPVGVPFMMFQLRYCGPHMDRGITLLKDERVSFSPEEWQQELIDVVDQRNCGALVVAPTSSGKTFVSYYTMKKVLLEDDESVVVYIAPTPSLVNQVAAEVFARFGSKQYPERSNRRVWGTYVPSHNLHPFNSQVLVTVPEIFELLLLSPDHAKPGGWISRIKYIILDEVHCMGSMESGVLWERIVSLAPAPIIALSATLGNPEMLFNWMRNSQVAHGYDMRLVSHQWRFSYLYHYRFLPSLACPGADWSELPSIHPPDKSSKSAVVAVGAPVADSLARIHPIGCLTVQDISRGSLQNLDLSPDNGLKLYEALVSVAVEAADKATLAKLDPLCYWEDRPQLLDYTAVRQWTGLLKAVLQEWSDRAQTGDTESKRCLEMALDVISGETNQSIVTAAHQQVDTPDPTTSPLVKLLVELNHNDLLPTIGFSFDRQVCEDYFAIVLHALRQLEAHKLSTQEDSSRSRKNTSRAIEKTSSSRSNKDDFDDDDVLDLQEEDDHKGPRPEFSFVKPGYQADSLDHLIDSLRWISSITDDLIEGLRRGIGIHHDGMPAKYRQAVETLFRVKHIRVVFSTQTLAMGINMPCRSVVLLNDSVYLNPTYFQQMSGRSGRRGFDLVGHVIFFDVMWPKIQRLMTSSLPSLSGSSLLSVSFVSRLICMYNSTPDKQAAITMIQSCLNHRPLRIAQDGSQNSIITHPEYSRFFFRFSFEYLLRNGLIDNSGNMLGNFAFVMHLSQEPANLEFASLMASGYFHRLCADYDKSPAATHAELILTLGHLFGSSFLSAENLPGISEEIYLPPLPAGVAAFVQRQEDSTSKIFTEMLEAAVSGIDCAETLLPFEQDSQPSVGGSALPSILSVAPAQKIKSPFASLSSTDAVSSSHGLRTSLISYLSATTTSLPFSPRRDSQNRARLANSYLINFWRTSALNSLIFGNRIPQAVVWFLIRDFLNVLKSIVNILSNRRKELKAESEKPTASSTAATPLPSSSQSDANAAQKEEEEEEIPDDWEDMTNSDDETEAEASPSSSDASAVTPVSIVETATWTPNDESVLRAFTDLRDQFAEKFNLIQSKNKAK